MLRRNKNRIDIDHYEEIIEDRVNEHRPVKQQKIQQGPVIPIRKNPIQPFSCLHPTVPAVPQNADDTADPYNAYCVPELFPGS